MIINTKEFQPTVNTILLAVEADKAITNVELLVANQQLLLNVTNKEYYVSVIFPITDNTPFHAVVDAHLFLNLIAGITSETFDLVIENNTVKIKTGKSTYRLPIIFENENILNLPEIILNNKTIEMPISREILQSIATVNTQEITKIKKLDVNELQRLYYIDETGCFTFTTGACVNTFNLSKPIKLLLNDKIVKLFKLFKTDVKFSFGHDALSNGVIQTKVIFEGENVTVSAIIPYDDLLLQKIQAPCNAAKAFISETYPISVVLSVEALKGAISRLLLFIKNSSDKLNSLAIPIKINFINNEINFSDAQNNTEVIQIENNSYINTPYSLSTNLLDIKAILDTSKDSYITMNCGNHKSIIFTRGSIFNLIPENNQD